jgi:hemolysin activation/secretion protein
VPRQTENDGMVTIAVLEGQLDQTRIARDGGYTPERLQHYENEAHEAAGHEDAIRLVVGRS